MQKITRLTVETLLCITLFGCATSPLSGSATLPGDGAATQVVLQPSAILPTPITTNETKKPAQTSACSKIAFTLTEQSDTEIYTACPDGSHLQNLTNHSASADFQPAWSPDGTRIAFVSSRTGSNQIHIMNADGSHVSRITSDHENSFPIWLPASRGKNIAFLSTDGKGLWGWQVINLENGEISQLTDPSYDYFFGTPAWSPDGKYSAYMSMVEQKQRNDGASQIHVRGGDGSNDIKVTDNLYANINPAWSPDGAQIAFLSEQDGIYGSFGLYLIDKDGSHQRKLSAPIFPENSRPTWSPDGSQIAISADIGAGGIKIIDVQTGAIRELLKLPRGQSAANPAWQPVTITGSVFPPISFPGRNTGPRFNPNTKC